MPQLFNEPEMQEIFDGFIVETEELLESLSSDLMELEKTSGDDELINRIFRSFHTIKGTSGFMGFSQISELTHCAEDVLNKLRKGVEKIDSRIIDLLLEVHDLVYQLLERLVAGDESPGEIQHILIKLENIFDTDKAVIEETENLKAPGNQNIEQDKYEFDESLLGEEGEMTPEEEKLLNKAFEEANKGFYDALENGEPSVEPEPIKQVQAPPKKEYIKEKKSETIRIDIERVEKLMDLSGELVLGRNRLSQISGNVERRIKDKEDIRNLSETIANIDFVTSEIQSAVMRMRMVPVAKLFKKLPRLIRDLGKEFGKKINLEISGEDTDIDRGIIEELGDPLVHMIRNSCGHGIESPDKRIDSGKPEAGTIAIEAGQEGHNIVLRVSDDGNGIDPEFIKQKALEKGIIDSELADRMKERDALHLIFKPGFSTVASVSGISGRGVGMDVVRTNIQKLKGSIEIESEPGLGTVFIIKLPLTLAIIQGLLVNSGQESYAIPLSAVEKVISLNRSEIFSVNQRNVISIREVVYPLLWLGNAMNVPEYAESGARKVVIVETGIEKVGIVVDELVGQQEIVVKSLGEYLGNIPGIVGATILGDGRVVMIVDVAEMINYYFNI